VFFLLQAREREMLQKLEEKDGESYQMKETHSTLQEEVDIKTKKLKKV
jgi:kinesin family protein 3/17